MATLQELQTALINADKAGDTGAATMLANEIVKIQGSTPAPQPASSSQNPIVRGAADLWMGARSIPDAGAQMVTRGLEAIAPAGSGFEKWARGQRENVEAINRGAQEAYQGYAPQERPLGSAVNRALGSAMIAGPILSKVAPAATMAGRAAQGVGTGVVQGAMTPVDDPVNYWAQKGVQEMAGGVIGGVASPMADAIGRIMAPQVNPKVQQLIDAKVNPTLGQTLGGTWKTTEEKLTSIPFIGDAIKSGQKRALNEFQNATYERTLAPLGAQAAKVGAEAPVGNEGIKTVGDYLSNAYEDALSRSAPSVIDRPFRQAYGKVYSMVPNSLKDDFKNKVTANIFDKITPAGTITPSMAKDAESELGRLSRLYTKSQGGAEQEFGYALAQMQQELRALIARNNPQIAPEIRAIDSGWANLVQIENAGKMLGAKEGVFTPSQYLNAIRGGDTSVRSRAFARGTDLNQKFAQAGDAVLSNKFPESGTTPRMLMAMLLGGGAGAGASMAPLTTAAVGAGAAASMLPYTSMGQRSMVALLTKRPELLQTLGQQLQQAGPYLTPPLVSGLLGR